MQPLGQRRKDDAADALLAQCIEQPILDPAVEHVVARLVDQAGRAQIAQDGRGLARLRRGVVRQTYIERAAAAHAGIPRAHRLLLRRLRIGAVAIEAIHIADSLRPLRPLRPLRRYCMPS